MVVTRRRSAAMAADRSCRSDVISSEKKKKKTATSTSSSTGKTVQRTAERQSVTKHDVNVVKQKVVTTESVIHQQTIHKLSPSGRSLADGVEPWELLPKTGYTYAKSPSYSQKYLDKDWEIPNMSRPGLRSRLSTSMALNSSASSHTLSFSHHASNSSHQQHVQTDASSDSFSGSGWRKSKDIDINEKEQSEEIAGPAQRLPPSVTRSGRRYGLEKLLLIVSRHKGSNQISHSSYMTASRDTGFSTMSVEEYMQLEKDMEYSGQSVPYKESPRLSLFGLDQVDEYDVSDTETDLQTAVYVNSSQSQQISSGYLWSLITTIISVISICCNWCWRLGTWIHEASAHVLLLDVWIHSRSRERRKSCCCCLLPLLLLLIPFLLLPVSHDWVAAVTKDKSHTAVFISDDKIETAKSSGISYEALREIIARELTVAKADLKTYNNGMYKENLAYIHKLEKQLKDQTVLLAQLNDCCKDDAVLAGLISRGVQEQLAMLMYGTGSDGGADGGSSGASYDSRSGQLSNSAFVHWLESHFSNSADFDAKIAALTELLNQRLKEQSEANRAALLAAKQVEQAAKEAASESEKASKIAAAVELAQGDQAAMWAKDKASLETLIAGIAADLKKTDEGAAAATAAATAANTAAMEAVRTAAAVKEMQSSSHTTVNNVKLGTGCVVEPGNYQTVTEDQVKLLIKEALGVFGADRTGMVDYALESAGGSVISTRCSETYHKPTAQLSLFGFPLWYVNNSPRTVIQPEIQPGQCWAFKGSQGYIVIQLAGWVRPTSFSLEHIPRKLSLTGKIDSAPKDFTVWGLKYERDTDGQLLGNYTYLDNDEPLQFFQVQKSNVGSFHIVELRIHSNHGNQKYTCLYRFRVHGVLTKF